MTTTARLRAEFPERYRVKDARTKVYRMLYGVPVRPDDKDGPEGNTTRKFAFNWSYQAAEEVFYTQTSQWVEGVLVSKGVFSPARYAFLLHRLETLRHYKHKGE